MRNQFKGLNRDLLEFFAAHAPVRMQELLDRHAPVEIIDRLDQDMTDIYYAMTAKN